jgi:hypothetical protein
MGRGFDMQMEQDKITFVSLGYRCETAWQIREFYGQTEAYPFDWLVTPFDTLPLMIEEDFEAIADPRYLRVTQYGQGAGWSVENTRYKLLLHHEFERAEDRTIVPHWLNGLGQVVDKFAYLRKRWTRLMNSSEQVCFIRRIGRIEIPSEQQLRTDREHYLAVFAAIRNRAPRVRPLYLFCDCDNVPVTVNVLDVTIGFPGPADWPRIEDRWKGRTAAFQDAFRQVLSPAIKGFTGSRRRFG